MYNILQNARDTVVHAQASVNETWKINPNTWTL